MSLDTASKGGSQKAQGMKSEIGPKMQVIYLEVFNTKHVGSLPKHLCPHQSAPVTTNRERGQQIAHDWLVTMLAYFEQQIHVTSPHKEAGYRCGLLFDYLDSHGGQPTVQAALQGGKRKCRFRHQAGLLQEHAAVLGGHGVQEGGHLPLGAPQPLSRRWMHAPLQPAESMKAFDALTQHEGLSKGCMTLQLFLCITLI